MQIILFILSVIGATHIVVDSKIFEPVRNLAQKYLPGKISYMLGCYQCAGLWVGMFCGLLVITNISIWQVFACGFAGSFLANSGAVLLNYLEAQTIVNLEDKTNG